jgi:hypothetical protein
MEAIMRQGTRRARSKIGIWTLGFALLCAAGCMATVPLANPQEDLRIKAAMPAPGTALVYLYRNESFGGAIKMGVLMDNGYSGETGPRTYMVWQLAPGQHLLVSKAENDSTLPLVVEPGRRYYVWQEVKMGVLSARSQLQLVPDAQGMSALNECQLIQMPLAQGH